MPDYFDQPLSKGEYDAATPHHGDDHDSHDDHGHEAAHSDPHSEQGGSH
jgi:hypothetical protein